MKASSSTSFVRQTLRAAAIGVAASLSYGAVEEWFSSILPRLLPAVPNYRADPIFVLLVFAFYAITGSLLGGLIGLLLAATRNVRKGRAGVPELWTVVALSAIYFGHASGKLEGRALLALGGVTLLAVGLAWYCARPAENRPADFTQAMMLWLVPLMLVGPLWTARELLANRTIGIKALSAAVFAAGVVGAGVSVRARKVSSIKRNGDSLTRSFGFSAAILVTLLVSLTLPEIKPYSHAKVPVIPQSSTRPNILLITMDTVRAHHLSLYGYNRDTAPQLARFANTATKYDFCIAPSDMTLTSHASLFTGQYAVTHGAHHDPSSPDDDQLGMPLPTSAVTIAEVLNRRGYETISVVANYGYLGPAMGLGQGFRIHDHHGPSTFGRPPRYLLRDVVADLASRSELLSDRFAPPYRRAAEINHELIGLIEKTAARGLPFFAFANYMDAHRPYVPPPPFDTLFPGRDKSFRLSRSHENLYQRGLHGKLDLSDREKEHLISQYDGAIAYIDQRIGELLTRLRERRLFDNTWIIITSDHGEAFGERGFIGHGVSVYQDQIHVPLLVKFPFQTASQTVNAPVNLVDIMPTILGELGFEIPKGVEGRDLTHSESLSPRPLFSESYWDHNHPKFRRVERTVIIGRWKLVSSSRGKRELYDLSSDPKEQRNLYERDSRVSHHLEQVLGEWLREVKLPQRAPTDLDDEARRALRALGYIR